MKTKAKTEYAELKRRLAAAKRAHKRTRDRWSQIESLENQLQRLEETEQFFHD